MNNEISQALAHADLPAYVQENDFNLSFPMKLMLLLTHVEREITKAGKRPDEAPIAWVNGGRAFAIRNKDQLVKKWLPLFFPRAKFSSFTRKLYRWGFRQPRVISEGGGGEGGNTAGQSAAVFFGHDDFQRDEPGLMSKMKSVTAASNRRQQASKNANPGAQGLVANGPVVGAQAYGPGVPVPSLALWAAATAAAGNGTDTTRPTSLQQFLGIPSLQQQQQQLSSSRRHSGVPAERGAPMLLGKPGPSSELESSRRLMLAHLHRATTKDDETIASRNLLLMAQQKADASLSLAILRAANAASASAPTSALEPLQQQHHQQQHHHQQQQQMQEQQVRPPQQQQQQLRTPGDYLTQLRRNADTANHKSGGLTTDPIALLLQLGGQLSSSSS